MVEQWIPQHQALAVRSENEDQEFRSSVETRLSAITTAQASIKEELGLMQASIKEEFGLMQASIKEEMQASIKEEMQASIKEEMQASIKEELGPIQGTLQRIMIMLEQQPNNHHS